MYSQSTDEVRFRAEYAAPTGCPSARDFVAGVTGRTARARVGVGPDSTAVSVDVVRDGAAFAGRVRIEGKETRERNVRGEKCDQVVDALALIVALAFDPEASTAVRPPEEPPSPTPPPAPRPGERPAEPAAEKLAWSFAFGAHAMPLTGGVPENGIGVGAWADVASEGALWAPSVVAFGEHVPGGRVQRGTGSAEFSLTRGGLVGCPVRLPAAGPLSARPCAGGEIGVANAESSGVGFPKKPTRLWLAARLSGRLEWVFARPGIVGVELGASFPLQRQRYVFDSGERVYETPTIAGFLAVSAGLRFF